MKKIICLLLAVMMVLSMAACGSKKEAAKTLKVALSPDFAPMEFVDATKTGQDQFVGFDVTLAKYIANEMGMTLELVPMSFDACQTAVATGNVDMSISGFSWTEERAQNYNLSDHYQAGENETEQVLITLASNGDKFADAASVKGLKVGAQTASLQESLATAQLPDAEIVVYSDITTGLMQLKKGDFDVMAVADGNADSIIASNPDVAKSGFKFEVDDESTDNVIMLQKGNDEMLKTVNEILAKAKAAGLYAGWYEDAKALAGIESAAEISYDDNGNVEG